MPYLICDNCNVYYEISKREMNDFNTCQCGNTLKYYETIEAYMNEEPTSLNLNNDESTIGKHFKCNKSDLNLILNSLKNDEELKHKEHLERDMNYKINHHLALDKEKMNNSNFHYKPLIETMFNDKNLKKKKEMLLLEMELLKESKEE